MPTETKITEDRWNELATECFDNSRKHGFWSEDRRNVFEKLCLVHSEISEALEALELGNPKSDKIDMPGLAEELADAVIRLADMAKYFGWNIGMYLESTKYLEGLHHASWGTQIAHLHKRISDMTELCRKKADADHRVELAIIAAEFIRQAEDMLRRETKIEITDAMRMKMDYNAGRPFMHGKTA